MTICLRRLAPALILVPLLTATGVRAEGSGERVPTEEETTDEVVVTGSRKANASINGLDIDPHLLPQNVRLLDDMLIDRAGFTDLSQLFDLAGGMSRQNSFGWAWGGYAILG